MKDRPEDWLYAIRLIALEAALKMVLAGRVRPDELYLYTAGTEMFLTGELKVAANASSSGASDSHKVPGGDDGSVIIQLFPKGAKNGKEVTEVPDPGASA